MKSLLVLSALIILASCGKSETGTRRTDGGTKSNQPATATAAPTLDNPLTATTNSWLTSQVGREKSHLPLTYGEENNYSQTNALLTYAAHNIPLVELHDEGLDTTSAVVKQARATIACGIGTLTTAYQAAQDCQKKSGLAWNAKDNGLNGEGNWQLIVRTESGKEVWADLKTGLLWSDVLNANGNWCQASGNQQNSNGVNCATLAPEKFCQDKIQLDSKGNLDDKLVDWRLPTRNDYLQADIDGLRFVLPNSAQSFWTATLNSANRGEAWTYHGGTGVLQSSARTQNQAIRCVGRIIKK